MRVALYARYSSDNQKDASIDDQIRLCRSKIEQEGWHLEQCYSDHAYRLLSEVENLLKKET